MNQRPCKLCPSKRYANISWCYKHFKEREKKKREEKAERKLLRKQKSKTYLESERKKLHRKCWKLMSEKVRRSGMRQGSKNECYTCKKLFYWKKLHAGHYRHNTLDFDSRNLKPQCNSCNTYNGGKLDQYTMRLIEENGIEWLKQLHIDADRHPGYRLEDLKQIYLELKNKTYV